MYGLHQEDWIAHDVLVKHLDPYGYHPLRKKTEYGTHNS